MSDITALGTDKITTGKILYLILLSIGLLVLGFFMVNVIAVQQIAFIYFVLGVSFLAITALSFVIKPIGDLDFINPIIHEEETLFFGKFGRKTWAIIVAGVMILAAFIFFTIGGQPTFQIVSAPHFQIIELTPGLSLLLTMFAAFMEDAVFFAFVPALIYVVTYFLFKNKWLSFLIALGVAPFVFGSYHLLVYGATSPVSQQTVTIFGGMMIASTLLLRSLIVPVFVHASNNMGINFFSQTAIAGTGFYLILTVGIIMVSTAIYLTRVKT